MLNILSQLESAKRGQTFPLQSALDTLQFNVDGLIPAIAQQYDNGEVLMMAWMNIHSIEETLQTGHVCYWSRSRKSYWRKGETSGYIQKLVEMRFDCDADTLLLLVDQLGPACHTKRRSCFYSSIQNDIVEVISEPENPDKIL